MRSICLLEDIEVPPQVFTDIHSEDFVNFLTTLVEKIDPICELVNKCQNPTRNMADATEDWLNLRVLNIDRLNNYEEIINSRQEKALWPAGFCANLLHHKYKGQLLYDDQKSLADDYFNQHLDAEGLEQLRFFFDNRDNFKMFEDTCVDPMAYWTFVGLQLPNLAKFAKNLMLMPASTALIEGLFSSWTYVHNIYRSRLINEKSAVLIDIYHALKHIVLQYDVVGEENRRLMHD